MDPARVLRSIRRARTLSQRELAAKAQLSPSTIARIEVGAAPQVAFSTVDRVLESTGYRFAAVDASERPLDLDEDSTALAEHRDRGGRQYPAHLKTFEIEPWWRPGVVGWWGWNRIAWSERDAPAIGYLLRAPDRIRGDLDGWPAYGWPDAT